MVLTFNEEDIKSCKLEIHTKTSSWVKTLLISETRRPSIVIAATPRLRGHNGASLTIAPGVPWLTKGLSFPHRTRRRASRTSGNPFNEFTDAAGITQVSATK